MKRLSERAGVIFEHGVRVLIVGTLSLASTGLVLGFFEYYEPWSVLPATAVTTVGLWLSWNRLQRVVVDPHDSGWALLCAMVGIIGLTIWHGLHSGNFLLVTRDPAFYNLAGLELARSGDLSFSGNTGILGAIDGVRSTAQGFALRGDGRVAYIQGFHGLSVVMAPFYWVGGLPLFLKAPAFVGGIALTVFRRLAGRVVDPWVATALTLGLGISIPFMVFVRDPYSESLFLVFILAAMLVLIEGPAGPMRYALAGLLAGGTALGRIDSLLVIAGFIVVFAALPIAVERRPVRFVELAAAAAGLSVTTGIGFLVGRARSPQYFDDLSREVRGQLLLVAAAVVAVLVIMAGYEATRRGRWSPRLLTRPTTVDTIATLVVAAGLVWWLIAPIVLDLRIADQGDTLTSGLQAREGSPVDSGRRYGEETLLRIGMFYGDFLVLLAVFGGGLLVRRVLRARDRSAVVIGLVAATALPYMFLPRISPDLPWAMRRYLPVVIPVTLLLAGMAMDWVRAFDIRLRRAGAIALVVLVGAPAAVAQPVWNIRDGVPLVENVQRLCAVIPPDGLVLVVHPRLSKTAVSVVAELCDVETVGLLPGADPEPVIVEAARLAREEGRVLGVVTTGDGTISTDIAVSERIPFEFGFDFVQRTMERLPAGPETDIQRFDLLVVPPDT